MVHIRKEGVELEEYVFFFIDLFAEGLGGRGPVRPWYQGDQDDYTAQLAFRVRDFFCQFGVKTFFQSFIYAFVYFRILVAW